MFFPPLEIVSVVSATRSRVARAACCMLHAAGLRSACGDGFAAGEKDSTPGSLGRGEACLCVVQPLHVVVYVRPPCVAADLPCACSPEMLCDMGGLISVCILVRPLLVLERRLLC